MVDYGNGKIYKLMSTHTNKIYIGSTCEIYLSHRLHKHRTEFKLGTGKRTAGKIIKYGDAKIILIEKYPCTTKEELIAREQYYIDKNKNKCVNNRRAKALPKNRLVDCLYCDCKIVHNNMSYHTKTQKHIEAVQILDAV